jgi:malic enzyme
LPKFALTFRLDDAIKAIANTLNKSIGDRTLSPQNTEAPRQSGTWRNAQKSHRQVSQDNFLAFPHIFFGALCVRVKCFLVRTYAKLSQLGAPTTTVL